MERAMRNEGITDRPVPPWEMPGAVRRDCEPHRGPLVQRLGRTAYALSGLLSVAPVFLLPVLLLTRPRLVWGVPLFPLVGFLPSLTAWVLARHDLALIRGGRMDPAGLAAVQAGRRCGAEGMALAGLSFASYWLVLFGLSRGP
jgi:hypothetical protein